jgi:chromosome segregation ATPase
MALLKKITWSELTRLEKGGHDAFLPSLGNDDLRYMMKSIRENFEGPAHLAEQNENELLMTAPKGQEARRNAVYDGDSYPVRVQELTDALVSESNDAVRLARDLSAANARIAELEEQQRHGRTAGRAANARADAAERESTRRRLEAVEMGDAAYKLVAERDQLAARVEEMAADFAQCNSNRMLAEERCARLSRQLAHDLTKWCTPEERSVLEACREMRLEEEDADDEPGEPVEVGEDCYIYTDDQCAIVRAELANRATKAKK